MKLSDENLYKVLDLLRNTEERLAATQNAEPIDQSKPSKVNIPIAYGSKNVPYECPKSADSYVDGVISTINKLNLDTSHYGILVSRIGPDIQINFGVANKFDARVIISPSMHAKLIEHVDFATNDTYQSFPFNVHNALALLKDKYNIQGKSQ